MSITIGIPFYNAELYLADAIRSVFAQTYQDWELLLVDDGSTDKSLEIANSVKDPRVRVLSDGENKRLSYRLNQITSEARFNLIGRMDADDLISPSRFEKQLSFLEKNQWADLITTGVCSINNNNHPVGVYYPPTDNPITGRRLMRGQCAIVHASILGKKSWFLRNPYDETIKRAQDYELWLRAFSKDDFNIHIMNEPLYYYREADSATTQRLLNAYRSKHVIYENYGPLWFNRWEILSLRLELYGKSNIVRLLSIFNKLDLLIKRRNMPIPESNIDIDFKKEIEQILSTEVLGL